MLTLKFGFTSLIAILMSAITIALMFIANSNGMLRAAQDDSQNCRIMELPDSGGLYIFDVPDYCINDLCTITFSWKGSGAVMGAAYPGLFPPLHVIQHSDGSWIGGPTWSIAGLSFSSGHGINGDSKTDVLIAGGETLNGNGFQLFDDSRIENDQDQWTISLVNNNREGALEEVSFYACK